MLNSIYNLVTAVLQRRLLPVYATGDLAWQDLKALVDERIADGLAGNVSAKGISTIVVEELGEDRPA